VSFWDELEAAQKAGTFQPSRKITRRCSLCGYLGHTRRAHGWTGRNVSNSTARQLAASRKASRS
jgi:hypothetical protein